MFKNRRFTDPHEEPSKASVEAGNRARNSGLWVRVAGMAAIFGTIMGPLIIGGRHYDKDAAKLERSLPGLVKDDGFTMLGLNRVPMDDLGNGWGYDREFEGNHARIKLKVGENCKLQNVEIAFSGTLDKVMDIKQYSFTTYDDAEYGTRTDWVGKVPKEVRTVSGTPVEHTFSNATEFKETMGETPCIDFVNSVNRHEGLEYTGAN